MDKYLQLNQNKSSSNYGNMLRALSEKHYKNKYSKPIDLSLLNKSRKTINTTNNSSITNKSKQKEK